MNICIPITDTNISDFKKSISKAEMQTDIVELRVDYIVNFDLDMLDDLKKYVSKRTIFTCRKKIEGGKFDGSEAFRYKLLQRAIDVGFDFVDIELSTMRGTVFKAGKSKIILSYHNFQETPLDPMLGKVITQMRKLSPDIMKIATKINYEGDSERLFKILLNKYEGEEVIIAGMGDKGKKVRLLSTLLGGFLTFASFEGKSSAPGQIEIEKMKKFYMSLDI